MNAPATLLKMPSGASLPTGLTDAAVLTARAAHGRNVLTANTRSGLLTTMREVVLEPMFLLLLAACAVYIALGERAEAVVAAFATADPTAAAAPAPGRGRGNPAGYTGVVGAGLPGAGRGAGFSRRG